MASIVMQYEAGTDPAVYLDDSLSAGIDFCSQRHYQLIHFLTGNRTKPTQFPRNLVGFAQYLDASKVKHLTADEVCRPKYPTKLLEQEAFCDPISGICLLPARWVWPRLVAPLCLIELARAAVGPIRFRHGYRPPVYNRAAGSTAQRSDHVFCCAVDVAFSSRDDLLHALKHVINPRWQLPEYGLSMGYNARVGSNLHLGVWAPETERVGRPRIWKYGGD